MAGVVKESAEGTLRRALTARRRLLQWRHLHCALLRVLVLGLGGLVAAALVHRLITPVPAAVCALLALAMPWMLWRWHHAPSLSTVARRLDREGAGGLIEAAWQQCALAGADRSGLSAVLITRAARHADAAIRPESLAVLRRRSVAATLVAGVLAAPPVLVLLTPPATHATPGVGALAGAGTASASDVNVVVRLRRLARPEAGPPVSQDRRGHGSVPSTASDRPAAGPGVATPSGVRARAAAGAGTAGAGAGAGAAVADTLAAIRPWSSRDPRVAGEARRGDPRGPAVWVSSNSGDSPPMPVPVPVTPAAAAAPGALAPGMPPALAAYTRSYFDPTAVRP